LWLNWLIQEAKTIGKSLIVAGDSVNPLTSTINNFSFLGALNQSVTAIIDDSHGIGIIGNEGSGMSDFMQSRDHLQCIFTYSLSKAFGIIGGAVSGSNEVVETIRSRPEYTGATPLSPAQAYAFVKGQHIYKQQREKLAANITYFEKCIHDLPGIQHTASLPVFVLPTQFKEHMFYDNDILISSFAYPDPAGKKLQRIVLNALHTPADLDKLAAVVKKHYYE
jgi:7-keto-8-aminopelargonate synthetase-like enzyme